MGYRKLELLLVSVGMVGIMASMMMALLSGAALFDLLKQALFIPVFFFAHHYGRRHGYIAVVFAVLVLLIARTQTAGMIDVTSPEGRAALAQISLFGAAGVIVGELAARIKYVAVSLADQGFIDPDTGLFSPTYINRVISKSWAAYQRDKKPFSLLFIELVWSDSMTTADKKKQLVRIANIIKTNMRLVDEVGCLESGRFCLVFSDTTVDIAEIANARLKKAILRSHHNFRSADWRTEILAVPRDEQRIQGILLRGPAGQANLGRFAIGSKKS